MTNKVQSTKKDDDPTRVEIPNKLYFSIGEVSSLCGIKSHVLRYWEQEFPRLKPVKRRGNRRYYQRKDILIILRIKELLQTQGYTIQGARNKMEEERGQTLASDQASSASVNNSPTIDQPTNQHEEQVTGAKSVAFQGMSDQERLDIIHDLESALSLLQSQKT